MPVNKNRPFFWEKETWRKMLERCLRPSSCNYSKYGAKGIGVSEEWKIFENFYRDMGPRPPGMSIDRIDSRGNYCKENCRWANRTTQTRNRKNCVKVTFRGETKPLAEWAEETGIPYTTLLKRISFYRMAPEKALRARLLPRTGNKNAKGVPPKFDYRKFVELFSKGTTTKEITRIMGCGKTTVSRMRRRARGSLDDLKALCKK